jgi:hypothetical protein
VASATKAALRAAADRQQIAESALLKRMLDLVLWKAHVGNSTTKHHWLPQYSRALDDGAATIGRDAPPSTLLARPKLHVMSNFPCFQNI